VHLWSRSSGGCAGSLEELRRAWEHLAHAEAEVPGSLADVVQPGSPELSARRGTGGEDASRRARQLLGAWIESRVGRTPRSPVLPPSVLAAAGEVDWLDPTLDDDDSAVQFDLGLYGGLGVDLVDDRGAGAVVGFRPELTFFRRGDTWFGAGPYAFVGADGFGGVAYGGGVGVVVPVIASLQLTPSVGAFGAYDGATYGGVEGSLLFGWRSYNEISHFDGASGLRTTLRAGLLERESLTIDVALQFDLMLIAAFVGMAGG
jgi:hypothetical protein